MSSSNLPFPFYVLIKEMDGVITSPFLVLRIGVDVGPLLLLERNFHLSLFHMLLDVY
jgi:hypothetical protein